NPRTTPARLPELWRTRQLRTRKAVREKTCSCRLAMMQRGARTVSRLGRRALATSQENEFVLGRIVRRPFGDAAAVAHHQNAVGDGDQLFELRGDDDDRLARGRKLTH